MKFILLSFFILTSCSFINKKSSECEKDLLSKFLKCDKDLIKENVLVYIEASVEKSSLKIDTIIGLLTPNRDEIISAIVNCVNNNDLSINRNCSVKFIYDRHGTKNHDYSSHQLKVTSFKRKNKLEKINVVNSTYYNN